ncbi:sensor histidine kinase [Sphingobacterium spiritivorum]|uniref:sensor histidine kinase n=1 Tax=Sphingobacterium spiritivorum TaxID=258 RepID=UPI003DA6096E
MMNKLNSLTSQLLWETGFRFLRHLLIFLMVSLITMNILWDEPIRILPDRYMAWIIYLLLFLTVIYINMYGLVPKLLLPGKIKKYLFAVAGLMFFFLISVGTLQNIADEDSIPLRTPPIIGILSGLATFMLFITGLTALQFFKYRLRNQQKINQLEKATMEIELANLQSQINPHFLFNMLNNANIMVEEDAKKSSEILSRFNALLQYQVEKGAAKSVTLNEEIIFLNDYLNLEKLRRDRFNFVIEPDDFVDVDLPPLLFIPFVENAVKHNPENDAFIEITFQKSGNAIRFVCRNNKPKSVVVKKEGGIGLSNIQQRLNLLFEKKHSLQVLNEKDVYIVIMEIEL